MTSHRITPLTESGLLSALTVILALAAVYLPVVGVVASLVWAIPVIVLVVRHGLRWGAMAVLVSGGYAALSIDRKQRHTMTLLYELSDTIGLASFTVTGTLRGLTLGTGDPYVFPMMLGVITAVGGGMLRDLMAQRVPVVLRMDVYAVASLAGAWLMCWSWPRWGADTASWLCFFFVLLLRGFAIHYGWQLYHPRPSSRIFRRRKPPKA